MTLSPPDYSSSGLGGGYCGRSFAHTTTFNPGRFHLHWLRCWVKIGRPHQTGCQLRYHPCIVQAYGWVALFSTNILLYVLLVLYVALAVKEKKHMLKEEKEKSKLHKECCHFDQFASVFRIDFIKKVLGIFKRLFHTREDGSHVWIMTLIGVLCLMQFFSRGPETVFFLFWKMQYGLTLAQYANMTVFLAVRTSIANWILIPFLSKWLQDTTLIIVSQLTSIVGITIHALGTTFPAFYASLVLFCFWSFGPTGTRCSFIDFPPLGSHEKPTHPRD